jgi:hypothetical protein
MEQRRLRLGDILDDYCPRERRVTNHAVVAMIEEDVKQTRCTTCDAEHAYKGAKVPKRRQKETPAALFKEVLAGMPEVEAVEASALAAGAGDPILAAISLPQDLPVAAPALRIIQAAESDVRSRAPEAHVETGTLREREPAAAPSAHAVTSLAEAESPPDADGPPAAVDGPVHRPLIRAQLPRIEGHKDVRPAPDFTVRHAPPNRGNGNGHNPGNAFRGDRLRMRGGSGGGNGQGGQNGNRAFGGPRPHGGSGGQNRPGGQGRPPGGRTGGPAGFRNGNGGPNGKRGRGSRG